MATIAEIRRKYPQYNDLSDRQLADSLRTKFYSDIPEDDFLRRVGLGGTDFIDDMQRGAGQAIASVGSALRDVPIPQISSFGQKAEEYGKKVVEANPADMPSVQEIKSVSDAVNFAGERVAEIIPQVAAPLAAAGVATLAGATAPIAGALGLGAGALSSFGQSYGGIREQQREQGIEDKARAAAFAAPSAALDILGVGRFVPGAGRVLGDVVETGLKGVAKTGARIGAEEGATEVAQTALERAGAVKPLTDEEARAEYLNALAAGAVGGGGIGAGGATVRTVIGRPTTEQLEPSARPQDGALPEEPEVTAGEPPRPPESPPAPEEPVVPATPFGEAPRPTRAPEPTVIVEDDTVIIEQPDGGIEVVPRAEWEARQGPAAAPVAEPAPTPAPAPRPAPAPENVRTVTTPGGTKVDTAFEVVDAADLRAATGDLQNRDRSRAATDVQVQDIFSNFDPARLGDSQESDRGSPIIGPDNVVESGNGRVMAINKVYDESPERAQAYRDFIESQGFSTAGMQRPVLVRRRVTEMAPDQRSQFVRESNMDTKLRLSTSEQAGTDAAALTSDIMGLMRSPDVNQAVNRDFVRGFLSKLPPQEQAGFIDKDGMLSAEGSRRLRTAIKASAYGDADLINTLDESQDNNIKSIGGALEDVAPNWRRLRDAVSEGQVRPEMDVTDRLVEAAKIVRDMRNRGQKVEEFLAQQDAFNPLDPLTERFIRSFYNEKTGRALGRDAIADKLDKYARRAAEQTTEDQLFAAEQLTPEQILDGIAEPKEGGLFDQAEAPSAAPLAAPEPEIPVITDELPARVKQPKAQTKEQEEKAKAFNRGLAAAIKTGNMGVVADYLANKGTLPTTREFMGRARNLIRTFEQMGISNRITRATAGKPVNVLERLLKSRDLGINLNLPKADADKLRMSEMNVALRDTSGVNEKTAVHEILHAVTIPAIKYADRFPEGSGVRKAAEDLRDLADKVAKVLKSGDPNKVPLKYARLRDYLATPEEIVTWGLTDYDFQQFMKTIPVKSGNAFTEFAKYIGRLLGVSEGKSNALTRLIEISESLIPADAEAMADVARGFKAFQEGPSVLDLKGQAAEAVARQRQESLTPTKETRAQGFARKLVDRFERLRVVQNLGQLREGAEGFYEAARKFDSRAGELMAKFDRDYFQPIQKIMKEAGLNLDTVDFYLYARAAPARNARLQAKAESEIRAKMEAEEASEAEINAAIAQAYADGKIPVAGSGITTQEAEEVLLGFEGLDYYPALQRIGELFNAANKERMENNIKAGLVSRAEGERLLEEEPDYVPMKGFAADENLAEPAEDFESAMGYGGAGFGVSTREWYEARGRSNKPFSPLGTFISDVGTSIVRGERNRVGQKLMDFFVKNPSDSWKVFSYRNPPRDRKGNAQRPSPFDPNFMVVKRGGDTFYLRIDDPLLAKAAKNLNPPQMGKLLQISSNVTRLLSRSFTTANPDFFVPNVFRDLQSAALNLGAEAPGLVKAFGKNVRDRKAFRSIAAFEYGKPGGDPALRKQYEQFKLDGGSVSWVQRETPQEAAARIQDELKTLNERMQAIKDAKGAKETIDALWNPTSKGFRAMVGALESTNAIFENGIRFAAYRAALDVGMTREQAAMVAREATVDFNRRGEAGAILNALYAFFNAGIQGTVRTARALANNPFKTGKLSSTQAALLGMMATAATLAAANAGISDEDDDGKLFWDKIPDYEKERNLIIMNPLDGETYAKIPMPYGFGFFPYLATRTMDAARRGDDFGAAGLDIVTAALGNFSPVQFSAGSVQSSALRAATPTMFRPLTELALNENFMGKPIYNEPFDKGQSYASVARYNTWEGYKDLAQFLNDITGGEGKVKGGLNVPPESFEYLVEFGLGGVTQLAKSLYRTGAEGEPIAAPVVRRLVGQPGKGRNVGEFYEREEAARVVNQQMKDLTGVERLKLREKFPVETHPRVQSALTSTRSAVRKLNEERKRIQNLEIDEASKAERLEALRERIDGEFVRFNRIYNQVEEATR